MKYINTILKFIQQLLIIIFGLTLIGRLPIIDTCLQALNNYAMGQPQLTLLILGVITFLVTVFMLPLTPVIAVIILWSSTKLTVGSMLLYSVSLSVAVSCGRCVLYYLSSWYSRHLMSEAQLNSVLSSRIYKWLNTK